MAFGTWFVCAVLLITVGSANVATSQEWEIEVIDQEGHEIASCALSTTSDGRPCIVYAKGTSLVYAFRSESSWQFEYPGMEGYPSPVALAVDAEERPHIACYQDHVFHVYKTQSGWQVEDTGLFGISYLHSAHWITINCDSTAIHGIGFALSFRYNWPPHWRHGQFWIHKINDQWVAEIITDQGNGGPPPQHSYVVGGDGNPRFSYSVHGWPPSRRLEFAAWADTSWQEEIVDTTWSQHSSLVLRNDQPHVCYSSGGTYTSGETLRYAYYSGSIWHSELVDSSGCFPEHVNLRLDYNDFPHIVYYGQATKDLCYAFKDGVGWSVETVESEGTVGRWASMDLDQFGYLHVAYIDSSNGTLKYARGKASPTMRLVGETNDGWMNLAWCVVQDAHEYWVYGASNLPHFNPGFAPDYVHRLFVLPSDVTTWSSTAGVGDPAINWTYLIVTVGSDFQEITRSNRVGEWDWGMEGP